MHTGGSGYGSGPLILGRLNAYNKQSLNPPLLQSPCVQSFFQKHFFCACATKFMFHPGYEINHLTAHSIRIHLVALADIFLISKTKSRHRLTYKYILHSSCFFQLVSTEIC